MIPMVFALILGGGYLICAFLEGILAWMGSSPETTLRKADTRPQDAAKAAAFNSMTIPTRAVPAPNVVADVEQQATC